MNEIIASESNPELLTVSSERFNRRGDRVAENLEFGFQEIR